jgi:phosphomannomutase
MKDIVLFDLDGTLTPPRKSITKENVNALKDLSKVAKIGIVTGSGIDYIKQQIPQDLDIEIELFPCNGTQHWIMTGGEFKEIDPGPSMKTFLGKSNYTSLLLELDQYQRYVMMSHDLPYTGTFISYRGSLVNWCPIGRDAGDEDRKAFEDFDKKEKFRDGLLKALEIRLKSAFKSRLTIKLGGSTSFDVFPEGWDKTYALKRINKDLTPWFVGDRCFEGGNDYEIFQSLVYDGKSHFVFSEKDTPAIVEKIISRIKS